MSLFKNQTRLAMAYTNEAGDMYSLAELLYPEDFVEEDSENKVMLLPFE